MPSWNPELYLKFGEERTRPALDLALRARTLCRAADAPGAAPAILDLGCGPGNSTAVLAAVFPGAELTGLDSSPDMIEAARKGGLNAEWLVADASAWEPNRRYDLVFSNAVLQWIPEQAALLKKMWAALAPGGVMAVQVPGNAESGLHRALLSCAADPAWSPRFAGKVEGPRYRDSGFYFDTLLPLGGAVEVWETTYLHMLADHAALIDWYSGSGMRPWLEALGDEAQRRAFKDSVLEAAKPYYPTRADGRLVFPFRRIFFTATERGGKK